MTPPRLTVRARLTALYAVLVGPVGRARSGKELLEGVWNETAAPFPNTVRRTVVGLRRRLGDPPVVHTVVGAGYRV